MKVFLTLLALLAFAKAGGKEKMMMEKWAKTKAMESCYGEEVVKKHMLDFKRAMAKCSGMDAPEIELPMFSSPYRAVQALLNGARDMEALNVERFQKLMKTIQTNTGTSGSSSPLTNAAVPSMSQYIPIPVPFQQPQHQQPAADPMAELMKRAFMKKMMKKFMNRDDDDDDDDMFDFGGAGDEEFAEMLFSSNSPFFSGKNPRRNRRQAEIYELGDRLAEKLMMQKEMMTAKKGNMSCVLKEMHVVDENMELDLQGMLDEIDKSDIRDDWLYQKTKDGCRMCYAFAQKLPDLLFDMAPMPMEWVKVKKFMWCEKMIKVKTCMNFDIKKKLEENFGPLQKLVDQTGMEEKYLLPMAMKLLHGDMDMMGF